MNQSLSKPTRWLVVSGLALAAVITIWLLFFRDAEPYPGINPDQAADLVQLKNKAIGQLENIPNQDRNDGSESIIAFAELSRRLPTELIGPRNLAVARLLALGKIDKHTEQAKFDQLKQECQSAVDELQGFDPTSGIADLLAAKLAIASGDDQAAITHYEAACKKMPNDYVPW
ncbi:MAG: hypothetical protein VB912_18485, partial [Pirellulaceae bacterium]